MSNHDYVRGIQAAVCDLDADGGSMSAGGKRMGTLSVQRLVLDLPLQCVALVALHLVISSGGLLGAVLDQWRWRCLSVWFWLAAFGLFHDSLISRLFLALSFLLCVSICSVYVMLLLFCAVLRRCKQWSAVLFLLAVNVVPLAAALAAHRFFARYYF